MDYLLAVDGGGTKTHVLCADAQGQVVGEGLSGPTNLTAAEPEEASFNLLEGIRQATEKLPAEKNVRKLVMGLAGLDTKNEAEVAQRFFTQALAHLHIQETMLVNDIVIAQYSGTDKNEAVTLIAGTGSQCFGRNEQGQEVKVGGMDFLLSDQGSGYAIGLEVLRQAVKSFDQVIAQTQLEKLVCDQFHIATIGELKDKVYHPLLKKTEVAELAKVCEQAAMQNDVVAREIFQHAVDDLFAMVATVMRRLSITDRELDCVMVGSIARTSLIQTPLSQRLQSTYPHLHIIFPEKQPVYGALSLALRNQ